MISRIRLDKYLVEIGFFESREKAQEAIELGLVLVDGSNLLKPSTLIKKDANIKLISKNPFVSRGGIKLSYALQHFRINPTGLTILDIGASTGGFTDCLIKNGASKVYALDVGKGQLDYTLSMNPKVVVLDEINFRNVSPNLISEKVDLITVDVSFISLKLIIPNTLFFLKDNGKLIALFKPQFEVGPKYVRKGIVLDKVVIINHLLGFKEFLINLPLKWVDLVPSPIKGQKGNQEYFLLITRNTYDDKEIDDLFIKELVLGGLN